MLGPGAALGSQPQVDGPSVGCRVKHSSRVEETGSGVRVASARGEVEVLEVCGQLFVHVQLQAERQ